MSNHLTVRLFAVAAALPLSIPSVLAQGVPDAGRLLNDVRPRATLPNAGTEALPPEAPARAPLGLPDAVKVPVRAITISGASVISMVELQAQVADLVGGERTLAELEQGARRITALYHARGYLLARAYLPAQDIADGKVEIHILEGRLGQMNLNNQAHISDAWLARRMAGLAPGQVLERAELEGSLLRLSDTPGLDVRSSLKPGASVGTTDLDIVVRDQRPVDANVTVDNIGNRYTGQYRLGGNVILNNPLGLGDALQLSAVSAGDDFNYGRVAYQLPLNASGTRLGLAYAAMHYKLGQEFRQLDGYGKAGIATVFLTHPLLRSRDATLNTQFSLEHKRLDDIIGANDSRSSKQYNNLTLGLSGELRDQFHGGGLTQASASVTRGNLVLDAGSAASDAAGLATQGHFLKFTSQVTRLQRLDHRFSLYLQIGAQLANRNLDSAEKMDLGGAYGVRAYPQGEAAADDAVLLNMELRYRLADDWQALGLFDAARARLNHTPLAGDSSNRRTLAGMGAGLRWSNAQGYSLQATVAWRTSAAPTSDRDRTPRVGLQLGWHL